MPPTTGLAQLPFQQADVVNTAVIQRVSKEAWASYVEWLSEKPNSDLCFPKKAGYEVYRDVADQPELFWPLKRLNEIGESTGSNHHLLQEKLSHRPAFFHDTNHGIKTVAGSGKFMPLAWIEDFFFA